MEVAEFFDVTISTVEAWIRRGAPVVQRGSRGQKWVMDLLSLAEWRFGADHVNPDEMSPKDRKDWYDGEKRRREMQVDDRELIPAAEFDKEYSRTIKIVAAGLETLPDQLELDAGLTGVQLEPVIRVIDGIRESLYQSLTDRKSDAA